MSCRHWPRQPYEGKHAICAACGASIVWIDAQADRMGHWRKVK